MKTSKIIARLLTLLGFGAALASCGYMYGTPTPDEYGSSHADFEIKGTVTNESGEPIEGIMVTTDWWPLYLSTAGVSTDENGEYTLSFSTTGAQTGEMKVTAQDMDGNEYGGDFAPETQTIQVEEEDYTGASGNWDDGDASKTADFELELKPQEDGNE